MPITLAEAAAEFLARRHIRNSLIAWGKHRGYDAAPHHRLICNEIEAFLEPSCKDEVLLLFAPPGSAKSTWVSVLTPSWYLAKYPTHSILAATHSIEFAQRWGRRVRNDIELEHKALGIRLDEANKASDRWAITAGGEYYGVGAGVGIAGFRADLGLGDDFFGSREDAYSPAIREKRWDWYLYDFGARLRPGAKRILMNTRWHQEDVAGRVLEQIERGIVKGRIINMPAKAEENDLLGRQPGEYLWDEPQGYDYGAFLRQREREVSPMMWSAQYQQRPAPETGEFFKAEWLKEIDILPARSSLRTYGASDYAVTADGGDYTVHIVVGVDAEMRLYVLDLWRMQTSSDKWVDVFCDLVRQYKPMAWAEEKGQIGASLAPFIELRQRQRAAYVAREGFPTKSDKAVRAQSIRGRMALSGLYVPRSAAWYPEFRRELLAFPTGRDDQVDALGLIGQLLDVMVVAAAPPPEETRIVNSGYRQVRQRGPLPGDWRAY
jgi:predicted phage terminase large subunit-like protein